MIPEGQNAQLLSSPTIGEFDATCTHHTTAPLITTTITYDNTTGQTVGLFTRGSTDTVPSAQSLPATQVSNTVLSNSSEILVLHVRYGANPSSSHVGSAELWVFQSPGSGCYVSVILTSNDTS